MLYFFLLLTPPPSPACILWIDRPPLASDYLPPVCSPLDWSLYDLRLVDASGATLCQWPASGNGLTTLPCKPSPAKNYRIEIWSNLKMFACHVWLDKPDLTADAVATQCPDWYVKYRNGDLTLEGPFEIQPAITEETACTLPQVDNTAPLATAVDYQFLAGRLEWWGINISPLDWQNQWDEQIRGAADAAGVPARLLKGMLANESQFWPLWTGTAGEQGWMQLTWDGADTGLRHDQELFTHYCTLAIWQPYCTSYDLLTGDQKQRVMGALISDLKVSGTPLEVADQEADDLWVYAHVLRAYACQAEELYPDQDVWQTAAVIYNAGTACIADGVICDQGQKYLESVWPSSQ